MSFDSSLVLKYTWVLCTGLMAVAACLLWGRGLHRQFPFFFSYVLLVLVRGPVLSVLKADRTLYFYSYWIAEAATVAFSLLVIYEIYRHVLSSTTFSMSRSTFFTLCVGLFAVAAATAFFLESSDRPAILRAIFILTSTARLVQVGLLALLLVASMFFGFYWQSLPFGFALGYGLYATTELVVSAFRSSLGPSGDTIFALTKVLSYQVAVLVWIFFIYRHREEHALRTLPAESMNEWLQPLRQVK